MSEPTTQGNGNAGQTLAPVSLFGDARRVCELIGSIYYYGKFRAETANERELEALLRKLGYFFESEEQLMSKLHSPNDKLTDAGTKTP
jgi:hypothetical protein